MICKVYWKVTDNKEAVAEMLHYCLNIRGWDVNPDGKGWWIICENAAHQAQISNQGTPS